MLLLQEMLGSRSHSEQATIGATEATGTAAAADSSRPLNPNLLCQRMGTADAVAAAAASPAAAISTLRGAQVSYLFVPLAAAAAAVIQAVTTAETSTGTICLTTPSML